MANEQIGSIPSMDPYGLRKYYGYRASDGKLIRTATATHPGYKLTDFRRRLEPL